MSLLAGQKSNTFRPWRPDAALPPKTPLQRLENWPVARALMSGPRVFEPHLRGLQARAQGVHPALERHRFQSAAKLAPTSNSHMTVSCACNDWPVAAECMQ